MQQFIKCSMDRHLFFIIFCSSEQRCSFLISILGTIILLCSVLVIIFNQLIQLHQHDSDPAVAILSASKIFSFRELPVVWEIGDLINLINGLLLLLSIIAESFFTSFVYNITALLLALLCVCLSGCLDCSLL